MSRNEDIIFSLYVDGPVFNFVFETRDEQTNDTTEIALIQYDLSQPSAVATLHVRENHNASNEELAAIQALADSPTRLSNEAFTMLREYFERLEFDPADHLAMNQQYGQTLLYMDVHVSDINIIG